MTLRYHPGDETLARYAARTLSTGTQIVVASHIEGCGRCAAEVRRFEAVGGALLDGLAETALAADTVARTFAVIERRQESAPPTRRARALPMAPKRPDGILLPRALDAYDAGPWRWLGPGICLSRVKIPETLGSTVILLRVAANKPMPEHGHAGIEYTQVLTGSLIDGSQRLMPGDLMEADEDLHHQPIAGPDGDCICLAAVDGKLRAKGIIGQAYLSLLGL